MSPPIDRFRSICLAVLVLFVSASARSFAQTSWDQEQNVIMLESPEPPDFGVLSDPLYPNVQQQRPKLPDQRLNNLTDAERAPFRLGASFTPEQSVRGSADTLSAHTISSQIAFPLQTYPDGILLSLSSLKYTQLSTNAVLPVSGTPLPDELWDIRTGMFITREINQGWNFGGLFNIGSASDQPFDSFRELTLTTLGFVSVPARNQDSWIFSVFYSPTSQIRFPIPGIAYAWRPNDQLEARVGLPASLTYAPNESFTFRARYTPITDVLVEARQRIYRDWSAFARYQIVNETYFLADREDRNERFFQFEQQLVAGLSRQLPAGFSLDLGAAYVFDRRFYLSDQFDLSSDDRIEIEPGISYTLQLIWTL